MTRHVIQGAIIVLLLLGVGRTGARAETPSPIPPRTLTATPLAPTPAVGLPTVAPGTGLTQRVQVLRPDAKGPAADGVTVILARHATREEYAEFQRTGKGGQPCATLNVAAGRLDVVPSFTADCPEGSPITAFVDYHDGQGLINANFQPALEWRLARAGDTARATTLVPDQPNYADHEGATVQPPATGDAALPARSAGSKRWGYFALAVGVFLGGASLALGLRARRRNTA